MNIRGLTHLPEGCLEPRPPAIAAAAAAALVPPVSPWLPDMEPGRSTNADTCIKAVLLRAFMCFFFNHL